MSLCLSIGLTRRLALTTFIYIYTCVCVCVERERSMHGSISMHGCVYVFLKIRADVISHFQVLQAQGTVSRSRSLYAVERENHTSSHFSRFLDRVLPDSIFQS